MIDFPQESSWVCLQLQKPNVYNSVSPDTRDSVQVWWPATLCFINHIGGTPGEDGAIEDISYDTFVDPLEEVEQWILGREKRKNIVETRQKEVEERQLHNSQPSDIEDYEFHKDSPDLIRQTNQYLSAQEASGIYPTPPDGLASNAQWSIAAQDTPGASAVGGNPQHATKSETTDDQVLGIRFPESNISHGRFVEGESQDLFGDMDTDMFDTNVLTEADFKFFDEPDEEVPEMQYGHSQSGLWDSHGQDEGDTEMGNAHDDTLDAAQLDHQEEMYAIEGRSEQSRTIDNVVALEHSNASPLEAPPAPPHNPIAALSSSESTNGIESQKAGFGTEGSLLSAVEPQVAYHEGRRSSFELVEFGNRPGAFIQKYGHAGKYGVGSPKAQNGQRPINNHTNPEIQELPKLGLLLEKGGESSDETDQSEMEYQSLLDGEIDGVSAAAKGLADVDMDSESGLNVTKKRQRESSIESAGPATPTSVSPFHTNPKPSTNIHQCIEEGYFDYRASNHIAGLMEQPISSDYRFTGNDQNFIQVAQLVADQAVLRNGVAYMPLNLTDDSWSGNTLHRVSDLIDKHISRILPGIQQCDLKSFSEQDVNAPTSVSQKTIALQEDIEKRRQTILQARGIKTQTEVIFKTQVPYLSVQRGEDALDLAPSALYFWEELGLAPSQPNKDVEALCIFPDNAAIHGAASTFLTELENSYQSCRLGSHRPVVGLQKVSGGLIPIPVTSTDPKHVLDVLAEACEALGRKLPLEVADGTNIVVYIVDPLDNETLCPGICAAFFKLMTSYANSAKKARLVSAREIVLQVIPLSFLTSRDSLTIPPPKAYIGLAFEVYSRCGSGRRNVGTMPKLFSSESAIRLAKPIPKTVNFQLGLQHPGNLLSADPCLHLAYSWDSDQQWLTCAWTDNLGATRWNAAYCLGDPKPDYWAAFAETVKEVLDTTNDMLQPATLPWKLYIVKDNGLEQRELEVWRLHTSSKFRQQMTITILSIDANPPLSLSSEHMSPSPGHPVSPFGTSQTAFTSHDQVLAADNANPSASHTPGRANQDHPPAPNVTACSDHDPSARLIDVVSQTWAMISPLPILDPYLPRQHLAPVLASGYLLKRAGAEESDGLIPLGVNLIATIISRPETGICQAHGKTLSEILEMYSDLATLARLRGLEEWKVGVLPWHVAAARKAKKAVTGCMMWGENKGD
ncbi:MAG: hypothetical protein Q9213_002988 [Squamulea squamosa]